MNFKICRKLLQYSAVNFRKLRNLPCSCSNVWSIDRRCFSTVKPNEISELIDCPFMQDDFIEDISYVEANYEAVTDNDPEKLKKLRSLQVKLNIMKEEGKKVPSAISTTEWKNLLNLDDEQCKSYIGCLWHAEAVRRAREEENKALKQMNAERREKMQQQERIKKTTNSPVLYSLCGDTLFSLIPQSEITKFYDHRLLFANWFGPHIVVDCGYESLMNSKGLTTCVKHLIFMWSENRTSPNPFNVIFCNVDLDGQLIRMMRKRLCRFDDLAFPLDIRSEHYLDLFPKENLVYLTADCAETLKQYNPQDVYVIGNVFLSYVLAEVMNGMAEFQI